MRLPALLALAALASAVEPTPVNQVFQWVEHGTSSAWSDGKPTKASTYLWIPEDCAKVRAVLVLCANAPEHRLVGHPLVRDLCRRQGLAIAWSVPSFMNFKRWEPGVKQPSDETTTPTAFLQQQLDALAVTSGYAEVATAPWIPLGESGHLKMVHALVESRPERCLAGVLLKDQNLPPANRTVPILAIQGTAGEWGQEKKDIRSTWNQAERLRKQIVDERTKNPGWALSSVIDGHSGHFDVSDDLTATVVQYLDGMVTQRLAADGSLKPVALDQGWVADLAVPGTQAGAPVRAAGKEPLPWYPDEATAKQAQAFAAIDWTAKTQFPVWVGQDGKDRPHDFNGITNFTELPFEDDGITFRLQGRLSPVIPPGFVSAGEPLATTPGTPVVEWICGPIEPLGDGRFRVALDRTWLGGGATYVGLRQAAGPGVRAVIQPAGIALRGMRGAPGKPQKISFPALKDVRRGTASVTVQATSDSGLPVSFFVVAGPAVIRDGNRVEFTAMPPRATGPVTVTIGAWQFGRRQEPAVKIAEVVQQSFRVLP